MNKLIVHARYAVTPNQLLNDPDISFRAKGVFAFLQSKPENWSFSVNRISTQTKDGTRSVRSALQELERHGYLTRTPYKDDKGHWKGYLYTLYESPSLRNATTGNVSTISKQEKVKPKRKRYPSNPLFKVVSKKTHDQQQEQLASQKQTQ